MLGNRFIFKSNKAKSTTCTRVRFFNNLNIFYSPIFTKETIQFFFCQVIVNSTYKNFITSTSLTTTSLASTLRLRLLVSFRSTLTIATITISPISATTTAPSTSTISPILLWLLPLLLSLISTLWRFRDQKTIRRFITISLSNFNISATNRVSVFFKHYTIDIFTLRGIVSIDFKSNKSKSTRAAWILFAHDSNINNLSKSLHISFNISFSSTVKNSPDEIFHKMRTERYLHLRL